MANESFPPSSRISKAASLLFFTAAANCSNFEQLFGFEPSLSKARSAYCLVFAISFGLLIDISVISITFFKGTKGYIRTHVFFAFVTFLALSANALALLFGESKESALQLGLAVDGLLVASALLQMLLGVSMHRDLTDASAFKDFSGRRKVHRANGLLFYFVGKLKLFYIAFYAFSLNGENAFVIAAGTYILALVLIYGFLLARKSRRVVKPPKPLDRKKQEENEELIKEIVIAVENYELAKDDSLSSVSSLKSAENNSPRETQPKLSKTKWFTFGEGIYKFPKSDHSGGNFFLRKSLRADVTRFLLGKSAFVAFDQNSNDFAVIKHKHGSETARFLAGNYIGRYARGKVFVDKDKAEVDVNEKSYLNLFANPSLSIRSEEEVGILRQGPLGHRFELASRAPLAEFVLALVHKTSQGGRAFYVDLKAYWIKMFGKYFLLEFAGGKKKLGFGVLSLNPNYLRLRREFLARIAQDLGELFEGLSTPQTQALMKMEDNAEDRTFSFYYPVFLRLKPKYFGLPCRLSSPIGFGLGFTHFSTERYLVLVKNEGLVPFVDLLEVLFQKTLMDVFQMEFSDWVFGGEYRLAFANGMSFVFLWIIDEGFTDWAETLGLSQFQTLLSLQQRLSGRSPRVLKDVWVDSPRLNLQKYGLIKRTLTHEMNLKGILKTRGFEFDRVLVSGDDAFKAQLFKGCGLEAAFLEKVRLIC